MRHVVWEIITNVLRERTGSTFKEFYPEEGGNTFLETLVTIYQSIDRHFPVFSNIQRYGYFLWEKKREANIASQYGILENKWTK
jgi:hypothetical protein